MAGPFDWLSNYLGGSDSGPGTAFGPDNEDGSPSIVAARPSDGGASGPYYTGRTQGAGDFIGPAGIDWLMGRPGPTAAQNMNKNVDYQQETEKRDAMSKLAGMAAEIRNKNPEMSQQDLFKQ